MRRWLARNLRRLYKSLPISTRRQLQLKATVFRLLGHLLSGTAPYQAWKEQEERKSVQLPPVRRDDPQDTAEHRFRMAADDRSPDYVESAEPTPPERTRVRALAFYLPQFHPIPENDRWWGKGFTEWRNVSRALPQFADHYQPHLPADLGFYDLRVPEVLRQQVGLAKAYGLSAFCFYFYWFGGHRLLERPLESFLNDRSLDFGFCLCWANENWSRRWDGKDQEVLIAQSYSDDDDLAFIACAARYLRDPRYLRVAGRPILIVYRPDLLPEARATAKRWRQWCMDNGIGEIHLAYVQTHERVDPARYGLDAAIEFPPNNSGPVDLTSKLAGPSPRFAGRIYDWVELARRSFAFEPPAYTLYRGVCPSWDNEPRKPGRGTVFVGSNPADYADWLDSAARETVSRFGDASQRLVFINAWNEWAEGAHLEPDQRYGHAWLAASRAGVTGEFAHPRLILVTHDARPHGAQLLALAMARRLSEAFRFRLAIVALDAGPLLSEFARYGEVLRPAAGSGARGVEDLAKQLARRGFNRAIINTTASGQFVGPAARQGIRTVALIHELPVFIRENDFRPLLRAIAQTADQVVFPSPRCVQSLVEIASFDPRRTVVRPQGLHSSNPWRFSPDAALSDIRERLGIAADIPIVLGSGFADPRKGVDWFVKSAISVLRRGANAVFIWLGNWDKDTRAEIDGLLAGSPFEAAFRFPGFDPEPGRYHCAADIFLLTSREDPFPTVVLQSLQAGVPVVAFADSGGAADLLERGCGIAVPAMGDTESLASAVAGLLADPGRRAAMGAIGRQIVETELAFDPYLFDLTDLLGIGPPRVSVVVPNYNYARYLRARIGSITRQTHPIFELIVLDDASTDSSIDEVRAIASTTDVAIRIVSNERNSGSVFAQWRKGIELARGEFVWIAEADDLSEPDFLERMLARIGTRPDIALAYCESRQIDAAGNETAASYSAYVADISTTRWNEGYVASGAEEVEAALSTKNTIPNVSAVLFRREALARVISEHFEQIASLRVAGDWMAYLQLLAAGGCIAFEPRALNLHRRHDTSVTLSSFNREQWKEIRQVQKWAARHFPLSDQALARADRYAQALYVQFGLASRRHPHFTDDPALSFPLA